ncbi:hypothetical protein LTR78_003401 [Recurvomyces mirabilis]|uniref:NmrA-like domain-containing protein n=1 Tax=Recurvomyces mirabilis TaxID=574656 RepID=A0AAE0WRR4_9PEZI|nr:hypothetical protein LTR78_003401 [Recurvomyces mirabilis]KAK5154564.1 hypothetical protein LTS14_006702 [Recurvomyces mirabilis]
MATTKRLLVTGATGKQGGALISALLSKPFQSFEIYAVTRNANSTSSQQLQRQGVKIIQGNLDDTQAIFSQIQKPVWGVFAVPLLDKGIKKEEEQGYALVQAAVEAQTSHIVYTTTDRGGDVASEGNPTPVPHFASKYRVEEDIRAKAAASNGHLSYTLLRPVAFLESMPNGFLGRAFVAIWRLNGSDRKLQVITVKDIGKVAAEAFLNAEKDEYRNKAISLAGDSLSPHEAGKIFQDVVGQKLPETYSWLGWLIRTMVADLRHMFAWFKSDGFGVDVPALRRRYPFMTDFRTWLKEESDWGKVKAK